MTCKCDIRYEGEATRAKTYNGSWSFLLQPLLHVTKTVPKDTKRQNCRCNDDPDLIEKKIRAHEHLTFARKLTERKTSTDSILGQQTVASKDKQFDPTRANETII